MKWRGWVITGALLVLVLATGAAYLATREKGTPRKSGKSSATQMPLVDVSPEVYDTTFPQLENVQY